MMHVQICCFVNKNPLLFCRSPSVADVVGFSFKNNGRQSKHANCIEMLNTENIWLQCNLDLTNLYITKSSV